MLKVHGNWESPDNWGPNHSLMVKPMELPERETFNPDLMQQMRTKRFNIIKALYDSIDVQTLDWYQRTHNPKRRWDAVAKWSLVEHMRYLECLYENEPDRFKGMSPEEFSNKRDEFYKNQPLVLTIPF